MLSLLITIDEGCATTTEGSDKDDADSDKYGRSDNDIRHSWPRFVVATL